MNTQETIEYLQTVPLIEALWWYIENSDGLPSDVFFAMRERVRKDRVNPKLEQQFEAALRKTQGA